MGSDKIDWKFKVTSASDFTLTFDMVASKSMFNLILSKALVKLKRQGKNIKTDVIEAFEVEERYYNLLHTILNKQIKEVVNNVRKDGIIILKDMVTYAKFTKRQEGEDWEIKIIVGGIYGRK